MPPVMGAVAFMMAEFMGVPYVEVAIAAVIPALLYYFAIYWTVDFEARRFGLQRMARADLPNPVARADAAGLSRVRRSCSSS